MKLSKKYLYFYLFASSLVSTLIFSIGFFPLSFSSKDVAKISDLPTKFDKNIISLNPDVEYKSSVNRVVFMVIDALRLDFIDQKENFPALTRLLRNQDGCLVKLNVKSPTVTMPRIKALTSGTIPSFLDVVLNLGSSEMKIDNILSQLRTEKEEIVFAGDSTWLSMFPKTFSRHYENRDSLFVNDFYEGDVNVTRSLNEELEGDWKLLILHYLGLDHIGHVEGPFSNKVPDKLKEMDKVVAKIYSKIEEWNRGAKKRSILFLTGDHGMRDSGGHGGSSYAETNVPLIMFGAKCRSNKKDTYEQVDFATIFAALNGLPVPHSSVGTLIPEFLDFLHPRSRLYSYYYTNKRLLDKLKEDLPVNEIQSQEYYQQYQEAKNLHKIFLESSKENVAKLAEIKYFLSSKQISNILMRKFFKLDLFVMVVGIILSIKTSLALLSSLLSSNEEIRVSKKNVVLALIFGGFIYYFALTEMFDKSKDYKQVMIFLLYSGLSCVNFSICYKNVPDLGKFKFKKLLKYKLKWNFLLLGEIVFVFSQSSSSFIEEEHQIWYFLGNTTFLLLIIEDYKISKNFKMTNLLVHALFLLTHSVIRRFNQTGDKWLSVPDIGDWLMMEENAVWHNICFVFGLLAAFLFLTQFCVSLISEVFVMTALAAICAFRMGIFEDSQAVIEVFCLSILIIIIVNNFPVILNRMHNSRKMRASNYNKLLLFRTTFTVLFLVCTLLQKKHNVILNGICGFTCIYINYLCDRTILGKSQRIVSKIVLHYWIGKMFYFYQGNSNNLASIDLNAGYVGLTQFNYYIVGIFLTLNVFNGQIITFFMLIYHLLNDYKSLHKQIDENESIACANTEKNNTDDWIIILFKYLTALITLPTTWFLIVITLLREHLFIWTVFSPKLLYEIYSSALMFLLMMSVYLITRINSRAILPSEQRKQYLRVHQEAKIVFMSKTERRTLNSNFETDTAFFALNAG